MTNRCSRRELLKLGGLALGATALASLAGPARAGAAAAQGADDPWDRVPAILGRIRPPEFPNRAFPITRYGAVGDGETDCTDAFRRAIDACHEAGGGRVLVPEGAFLTGAVHLRSNVELHVTPDATVRFSTDPAKYLPVVLTRWEGVECFNYSPFIYAHGQENVAVTGPGTLDGQASKGEWESWYQSGGGQKADQEALRRMGWDGVPVEQRQFGAGHYLRPTMLELHSCRNVLISDVTIVDPAFWTVHPVLSRNVTVRDVTVHSTLYNTDGCDPDSCADVHISGCRFDTNDDCIAVKSGRDDDGRRVGVPSTGVVVEGCKFSGRWGGLAIGSEMSGGVGDVFARGCAVNPADFPGHYPVKYPLYVKTNKLRGGVIDGVHMRDITGQGVEREALYVILNYNNEEGTQPVVVQNVTVEDMVIDGARRAVWLYGLETDHIRHVRLSDSRFTNVSETDDVIRYVDDLAFTDVTVNGAPLN